MHADLLAKASIATSSLAALPGAVVAFSGGVDSTVALALARVALGQRCLAVTGLSPTFPPWERDAVAELARDLGVRHRFVQTHELRRSGFRRNAPDRCLHCKRELFARLQRLAGGRTLVSGDNADDAAAADRPGRRALEERHVFSPLVLAGLTKQEVRDLGRELGLPNWDKPALACLASRLPFGVTVTVPRLRAVAQAEAALRGLGLRTLRVRHHGELARLEVGKEELRRLQSPALRREVARVARASGYRYVALDLELYQQGRLHRASMGGTQELEHRWTGAS